MLACLIAPIGAFASDRIDEVIRQKLDAFGPWYTPTEAAFVREQCGYTGGDPMRDVNIKGDVMTCNNGRRVQSPRVRTLARDISRRAEERVRVVMSDPAVTNAIKAVSDDAVHRALKKE